MRKSITVTTFLMAGTGAAGVTALPSPYQGSDTLFNVTTQAIAAAGLTPLNAYVGGGSGNAASAMSSPSAAGATQQTGPMSRMPTNEGKICTFNGGTNGSTATSASGIVIGLDAVDVLSSTLAGGQATLACNGTADGQSNGLAFSGTTGVFSGSNATQNWKWVLALVYGGKDLSPGAPAAQDCNSTARRNLVANWTKLFQNGCTNTAAVCNDATHGGALWHAFRRDDTSGTSDVFAGLLGIAPGTSNSVANGFGRSPYCNAMNWDTAASNANCAAGNNMQWVGPGGIPDTTVDATGAHKQPPPGTWGTAPDTTQGGFNADVLPTQFQDNDPIRRPCIGTAVGNPARPGEEVCNLDGKLGLVLPMPDSDWMLRLSPALQQYPTNACSAFRLGAPPTVFTCAIRGTGTKHSGECPNGDSLFGGGCEVPYDSAGNTSQCVSDFPNVASIQVRSLGNPDGRVYNLHMRDGTTTDGAIGYAQYNIASLGTFVDFTGGFSRIHQKETMLGTSANFCQLVDMTDNIGCLAQADPCSIGYAGDGGKTWGAHNPGGAVASNVDAMRIAQIAPATATVQKLGTAGEYQASRKLYFVSLRGFANLAATTGDPAPGPADELTLAKFEANPTTTGTNMRGILLANGFFELGSLSPGGANTPFCEDFNEDNVCNGGLGAGGALGATNTNACPSNPTGIPTVSTICGNGTIEAFEECDDGANQTALGTGKCSATCRCKGSFTGPPGASGDSGCI
jgi:cysteine-rich repeat protein